MRLRIALSYGLAHALAASALLVLAGMVLEGRTVGVTRQPLPVAWLLGVVQVVVSQLPLQQVHGALERAAVRGRSVRATQAAVVALLLAAAPITYMSHRPTLTVLYLLLSASGFAAGLWGRTDPWVWTLTLGMGALAMLFISPVGGPIGRALGSIPMLAALCVAAVAATAYVVIGPRLVA